MWDFRRQAWTFRSGGAGSGIFNPPTAASTGPNSPTPTAKACPRSHMAASPLAVAPSKPQVVYAMIESKSSALFRSDDGGKNWTRARCQPVHGVAAVLLCQPDCRSQGRKQALQARSRSAAQRERRQQLQLRSPTRTATFTMCGSIRPTPTSSSPAMTAGCGAARTAARAGSTRSTCRFRSSTTSASTTDDPYHVYGGLQDNSSWVGDSSYPGGITNARWENMYGGDGFWTFRGSVRPRLYLRRGAGRRDRPRQPPHARNALHQALPDYSEKKLRLQLEHADRT